MVWAYVTIEVFYMAGLCLTRAIAPGRSWVRPPDNSRPAFLREMTNGRRYVWVTPWLLAAMCLAFVVNLTAFPMTIGLLPYVTRELYRTDQTGIGTLVASFSLGALLGSLAIGAAGRALRPARMMIIFAIAWYAAVLVFVLHQTRPAAVSL
jgi:predicted MFS family arabinose efflux permease